MDNDTTMKGKKAEPAREPLLVLCASPITLLLPTGGSRLAAGGKAPSYVGLRFERGPNILAGRATVNGKPAHVELAQLPREIAALPEADREAAIVAALDKYKADHTGHAHLFEGQKATFVARGTVAELMKSHYIAFREACEKGTHRATLEALLVHPSVDDPIRQLLTIRLSAWRQEEAA